MVERRPEDEPVEESASDVEDEARLDAPREGDEPPASSEQALPAEPSAEERLINGPDDTVDTPASAPAGTPVASPEPDPQAPPPSPLPSDDASVSGPEEPAAPRPDEPSMSRRRLMRSRDHQVLGGVSGGIAERFDTDPALVRVLFVLLALFTAGLALFAYVVLWVVMPLEPASGVVTTNEEGRDRHASDPRAGGLILGLLLVVVGVVWLLQETDAIDIDWSVVLAITLIGVGVLLVLTLGSVARGMLISLGILLTVALAVVSLIDINFESSFGDRTEEPETVAELQPEYSHAFGSMTLDLHNLELPDGTTEIKASTSFGSLEVILPPDVPVRIEAQTTFGSVEALDREANGLRTDRVLRDEGYDDASRRIDLEVVASFGSVEVSR